MQLFVDESFSGLWCLLDLGDVVRDEHDDWLAVLDGYKC